MDVQQIMTMNVACVRSGDTLSAAARLMWDCDCGSVPVVDPTNDEVVGIITDRDICIATWSRDQQPSSISVSEAMSSDVVTCLATDSIASVESLMHSKQVRRVPVVDRHRRLVGIVSLGDIAVAAHRDAGIDTAPSRDVAAVLARVSTRRNDRGDGASAPTPRH
jgi:CBS domain-containing protein